MHEFCPRVIPTATFINILFQLKKEMVSFNYKRGQSSMEFLILMSFLTFVIMGILTMGYFYSNTINDRMKSSQITNFANKIILTSETVFYAGEPSKATISAHLPIGVNDIEIIDDAIIITYHLVTGQNKVAFSGNVPIVENSTAELSSDHGIKNLIITTNSTHAIVTQN